MYTLCTWYTMYIIDTSRSSLLTTHFKISQILRYDALLPYFLPGLADKMIDYHSESQS